MFLIWSTCLPSPKKLPLSSAPSPRPTGHWHCTFTVSLMASALPSQPHFSPTSSTYIFWDYSFQKTSWPPQRWLNFFNYLYIMFIWDLNLMYTFHCVVLVCLCILSPDPTNLSSSRTRTVPSLLGSPASSTKLGTNPVLSIWGGKEGRWEGRTCLSQGLRLVSTKIAWALCKNARNRHSWEWGSTRACEMHRLGTLSAINFFYVLSES